MKNQEKFRIRKKADKYVVEKLVGEDKWEGRTLFPEKLWNLLVSQNMSSKVSESTQETNPKVTEKFAHHVLYEQPNEDTNFDLPIVSKEDIERARKKLLGEE